MSRKRARPGWSLLAAGAVTLAVAGSSASQEIAADTAAPADAGARAAFLETHCSRCHNDFDLEAGLSIYELSESDLGVGENTEEWEKVLRKVSIGEMPPHSRPQPSDESRSAFTAWLEASLDSYAAAHPDPGRATLRRLNRAEYANAVRDLLSLDVDFAEQLPTDNSGYGFDNIADVLTVSPTLMERYIAIAGNVARLATGLASDRPVVTTYQVPKDGSIMNSGRPAYNERASDDLPLTSRGGGVFEYYAPHDGTYEIAGFLNANTNNEVDRMAEDRYGVRVTLEAGPHTIGMAFRRRIGPDETIETLRNTTDVVVLPSDPPADLPLDVLVDGARVETLTVPSYRMSPRFAQTNFPRDVLQIDVTGPFDATGPGDTPSRRAIFICQPADASEEAACAGEILQSLARRAYRRPVTDADVAPLLSIYAAERAVAGFEHGVAAALEAILVSPSFLFVRESDPDELEPGAVHPVSDVDLASRLSLFLWSSIPDEELLALAEAGALHEPDVIEAQVARMLADPRADALTENFAGQWLYLRNLEGHRPDIEVFPEFDTRLRSAMARETELFFSAILAENRSILDFIAADYTFLNDRLADHYGVPGVEGAAFRRVALDAESNRGGLLGQASILTVTSYGNHTSVVKRGQWVLANILAAPPPPPPADVPALQEATTDGRRLGVREQLELHRADPVCASCHVKMDPLGFALERYDAVGAFRAIEDGVPIDVSATMPDGTSFSGLQGLQDVLLAHRRQFAGAFAERLLTYALARGLTAHDQPTVRQIVREAEADDYRIQTIVQAIVASEPFTMRRKPEP